MYEALSGSPPQSHCIVIDRSGQHVTHCLLLQVSRLRSSVLKRSEGREGRGMRAPRGRGGGRFGGGGGRGSYGGGGGYSDSAGPPSVVEGKKSDCHRD